MTQIKQVFAAGDRTFDTKAEAMDYLRRPLITKAFNALTGDNAELTNWLIDHEDDIERAFETGTIRRVTKAERKQLATALDRVVELHAAGDKKLAFLAEQAEGLKTSFKLPPVPRMTDEEKAAATKLTLMAATENNEELVDWLIANREPILEGYQAGVEKRAVSPKATEALLAYRIETAEKKLADMREKTDSKPEDIAELEGKIAAMKAQQGPSAPSLGAPAAPAADVAADAADTDGSTDSAEDPANEQAEG